MFEEAAAKFEGSRFAGLGFEFSADDGLCGVDLDGCRDRISGVIADWAKAIIVKLNSYAEVSPSQTGVKVFIKGKSPFDGGRKKELSHDPIGDKRPAIEVYDRSRYFAVTGWRLGAR